MFIVFTNEPPPLIPPQGGKAPTNQFIFGIAESIFEKLEKLFFSRSFRISPFGGFALSLSKGDKGGGFLIFCLLFSFVLISTCLTAKLRQRQFLLKEGGNLPVF